MGQLPDTKVRIKVVDVETTAVDGDPDWVHAANKAVLFGVLDPDWSSSIEDCSRVTPSPSDMRYLTHMGMGDSVLMIGHNLAFDIGYLLKEGVVSQRELARYVRIWDTMVAEYILSGQRVKFAKLEELCASYSVPFTKDPAVTSIFAAGRGADAVPLSVLTPYLKADLRATYAVFLKQYEEAVITGKLPLIMAMMDFRLATIDMRWNGVGVSRAALLRTRQVCKDASEKALADIEAAHKTLRSISAFYGKDMELAKLDPTKSGQLANLLFGGAYKKRTSIVVGKYKNGNDKSKIVEELMAYSGLLAMCLVDVSGIERSADEDTLEKVRELVLKASVGGSAAPVPGAVLSLTMLSVMLLHVLAYRKAMKVLSTYVEPSLLDADRFANTLRPSIQVTTTNTGRTSCSNPNLQNVPKNSLGFYRQAIVPQMPQHKLVEFDYKQLEVVALAVLSLDKQLTQDLIDGMDMHSLLFSDVHDRLPSTDERTDFKRAVFCLIYGGGVNAIAAQGNTTPGKARALQAAFRIRYPATILLRATIKAIVEANSKVADERKYNIPHRVGYWDSSTGRTYTFEQRLMEKARYGGMMPKTVKECDWSTQEIANYPIQGLATADMVPLMVGMLYRFLYSPEMQELSSDMRPRLLIAVHDSVLVEVYEPTMGAVVPRIREFLEQLPYQMKKLFNVDCNGLPFKVGVSVGSNWEQMSNFT